LDSVIAQGKSLAEQDIILNQDVPESEQLPTDEVQNMIFSQ